MDVARRPPSLALPFAVIGAAGGWLTAVRLGVSAQDRISLPLSLVTPCVAALLGWALSRWLRGRAFLALLPVATVMAGALNGAVVALVAGPPDVCIFGAMFGAAVGAVFILPLAPVALAWARVGRARAGTRVDAVHRRAVWVVCALAVVTAGWLGGRWAEADAVRFVAAVASGLGLAALLALTLVDGVDLARLVRAARRVRRRVPLSPGSRDPAAADVVVDFGLGEEVAEVRTLARDAYRDMDRRWILVRGSPVRAGRSLARALSFDGFALGAALFAPRAWVATPTPPAIVESSAATDPSAAEPIKPIYTYATAGRAASIAGIDRRQRTVTLRFESDASRPSYDVVDYVQGLRIDHWEPEGSPGAYASDLRRARALAAATDDGSLTGWGAAHPGGASFAYRTVQSRAGDVPGLFLESDGGRPRRLDVGGHAADSPSFSPDGARIAFRGCGSACNSALYVALLGRTPRRVGTLRAAGPPSWGTTGRYLYATASADADLTEHPPCLYEVDVYVKAATPRALLCGRGPGPLDVALSPDRTLAVVGGYDLHESYHLRLVHLPEGTLLGDRTVPGAVGPLALSNVGLVWVPRRAPRSPMMVDFVGGREHELETKEVLGEGGAVWSDDHELVTLARSPGSDEAELVVVDASSIWPTA